MKLHFCLSGRCSALCVVKRQVPKRSILGRLWVLQCSIVREIFGSSVILSQVNPYSGWDIHDAVYSRELLISNRANGYHDILASIDLSTYRRLPWENNVPFFLVSFFDPDTRQPLCVDPRGVLKKATEIAKSRGLECISGVEYEVCDG
jgi:hypothetical protein